LIHLDEEQLAHIAHDLRTPMAALRLWIEVLRSGRPEDHARAIEAIDRCARAQELLIDDLLGLARTGDVARES
jgi:signal transduction histidine kinase